MAKEWKMNKDEFTRYVSVELEHGKNVELEYRLGEVLYKIFSCWYKQRYQYT